VRTILNHCLVPRSYIQTERVMGRRGEVLGRLVLGWGGLLVLLALLGRSGGSAVTEEERLALVAIYESTDGPGWVDNSNWLSGDPCHPTRPWFGLYDESGVLPCTDVIGEIRFDSNGLKGSLPDVFAPFSTVRTVRFLQEGITGQIPASLFLPPKLEVLNIYDCSVSSTIPSQVGLASELRVLHLSNPPLTVRRRFHGSVPSEIGKCTKLEEISLSGNRLSPPLPREMRNLKSMVTYIGDVSFLDYQLFPWFICNWPALRQFNMRSNGVTGWLPACLGNLRELDDFVLATNALRGSIPDSFRNFSRLTRLELDNNALSGGFPELIWSGMSSLQYLNLGGNGFDGTLSPELASCQNLVEFDCATCQLSGTIPTSYGLLSTLSRLTLLNNNLSGTLPTELCNLERLTLLRVGNNALEKSIPSCVADLTAMRYFDVGENELVGSIPHLQEMSTLVEFVVSYNQLTGSLPNIPTNLVTGLFNDNNLSGKIPASWGPLPELTTLDLSRNSLGGLVPPRMFADSIPLAVLLAGNNFSGWLDESLCDSLRLVRLEDNPHLSCPLLSCCRQYGGCEAVSVTSSCCGDDCVLLAAAAPVSGAPVGVDLAAVGAVSAGMTLLALLLVAAAVVVLVRRRRAKRARVCSDPPAAPFESTWRREGSFSFDWTDETVESDVELKLGDGLGFSGANIHRAVFRGMDVAAVQYNCLDGEDMARMRRECQSLRAVAHPNIVRFFGLCYSGGQSLAWNIIELPSRTLEMYIHNAAYANRYALYSRTERFTLAYQVATAVRYLHSFGDRPFRHGAINTGNVFYYDEGIAKLSGFGICGSVSDDTEADESNAPDVKALVLTAAEIITRKRHSTVDSVLRASLPRDVLVGVRMSLQERRVDPLCNSLETASSESSGSSYSAGVSYRPAPSYFNVSSLHFATGNESRSWGVLQDIRKSN